MNNLLARRISWIVLGKIQLRSTSHFLKTLCILPSQTRSHYIKSTNTNKSAPVITNVEKQFQEKEFNFQSSSDPTLDDKASAIRSMKYTFAFLGLTFGTVTLYTLLVYGKPPVNENGVVIKDDFSHLPLWKQYILRAQKQVLQFAVLIQEPSREKLLPDPLTYPYYQPPYTLILEFTDVLAHPEWTYQTGWRFKKRPGVDHFLESLSGLYEIVVFTAEPGLTIFPVIEALDQKGLISYKLVRDSTHFVDGHHVKNLERLNRDLKKVIVIDWNSQSVKFQPDNHFAVERWRGQDDDNTLIELAEFLKAIARMEIEDVREVLKFYKQFDEPLEKFKEKQVEYMEAQKKVLDKPVTHPKESVKRLFSLLL